MCCIIDKTVLVCLHVYSHINISREKTAPFQILCNMVSVMFDDNVILASLEVGQTSGPCLHMSRLPSRPTLPPRMGYQTSGRKFLSEILLESLPPATVI